MARANRHYLPGNHVWHITHRCHKREFLLKFARDRRRWLRWLFEAKKRYGLSVLNYMVTSNHVHLLVMGSGKDVIWRSIQLLAGRTAQDYNRRKERKGAFWEDRYHATAVQADSHLIQCLVYIDLNMVRAGVVKHPSEWSFSGYNEIQNPAKRYSLLDRRKLMELLGIADSNELSRAHRSWVEQTVSAKQSREGKWTESIAVGSEKFIEKVSEELGIRAAGRSAVENADGYELRERGSSYRANFDIKNDPLSVKNTYSWETNS